MKIIHLMLFAALLGPQLKAEWQDPHPLQLEQQAPVALLPFPHKLEWLDGQSSADSPITRTLLDIPDKQLGKQGYRLLIKDNQISISACSEAGLFYAEQTLKQLRNNAGYANCRILDYPAFELRGFMHDTGRNFQSIEELKRQLEIMASFKLNVFHWHLTDHPAWRIESLKYPQLNAAEHRTALRDVNSTYTYAQIRDLFAFAQKLHIQIIPEIDMPGHSQYFEKCFGFKMHSAQGMQVLEQLLEEFFEQIPADMAPYFHFGADEVNIPNAAEFVDKFSTLIRKNSRTAIQWAGKHDLPVAQGNISQLWNDEGNSAAGDAKKRRGAYIDSSIGYINSYEPNLLVKRIFFRQPCGQQKGDDKALGTIICLWPDVRVADKQKIVAQNAQWPAVFVMAERSWKGLAEDASMYAGNFPPAHHPAAQAFSLFEQRMRKLAGTLCFPYYNDSSMVWKLYGPAPSANADVLRKAVLEQSPPESLPQQEVYGSSLVFRARAAGMGMFHTIKPGNSVWAETTIETPQATTIKVMAGFDSPARSTRRCSGIPDNQSWSQCATRIWLNGQPLENTQTFKFPLQRRFEQHTWMKEANEMPYDDEEFWWLRAPVSIQLKAGKNRIVIEQPYIGEFQNWEINFHVVAGLKKN